MIPLKRTMLDAGAVGDRVDPAVDHAAGRGELLAGLHEGLVPDGLVLLDDGDLGHVVHVAEVRGVDGVLAHLLDAGLHDVVGLLGPAELAAVDLQDGLDLPGGGLAVRVVPGVDEAVALHGRVGADLGLLVGAVGVRDVAVGALGVELPAVERAHDLAALDGAAVAEVGAEVRAERVLHVDAALLVAPQHEVGVEVVGRLGLAHLEVGGLGHREPPGGDGERVAAGSVGVRASGPPGSEAKTRTCSSLAVRPDQGKRPMSRTAAPVSPA